MSESWAPPLRVGETATGCRLTLVGVTYGNGETLQDAADDLVARLLNLVIGMRTSGFRFASELGPPDRLDRLVELVDGGVPLVGLTADEAVEVLEPTAGAGPVIERPHRARLPHRHLVALAELGRAVAVEPQGFGQRRGAVGTSEL